MDDNELTVLTRFHDGRETVQEVVARIGAREDFERRLAVKELMILGNLQNPGPTIEEEIRTMPILEDIWDRAEFGALPKWALRKMRGFSEAELERRGPRLFGAKSLDELFS